MTQYLESPLDCQPLRMDEILVLHKKYVLNFAIFEVLKTPYKFGPGELLWQKQNLG